MYTNFHLLLYAILIEDFVFCQTCITNALAAYNKIYIYNLLLNFVEKDGLNLADDKEGK